MTRPRIEIQIVNSFEFADLPQCFCREWGLALEGVEHNAFKQITECHILVVGQRLQHLEESSLHADTRLHTLDLDCLGRFRHGCPVESLVPVYKGTNRPSIKRHLATCIHRPLRRSPSIRMSMSRRALASQPGPGLHEAWRCGLPRLPAMARSSAWSRCN